MCIRDSLRVDARKWAAAKLRPRTYGDRVDVSVQETRISIHAALAEAEARVLAGKAHRDDAMLFFDGVTRGS